MIFMTAVLTAQLLATGGTPRVGQPLGRFPESEEPLLQEVVPVVPVDRDEYRLAPGDMLVVTIEGGVSEYLLSVGVLPMDRCQVTLDGRLNVSGIGSIHVEGMSISEAQHTFDNLVRSGFPSLRAELSLAYPRMVGVEVRGMVEKPGRYSMYATERVSDVILKAGGIRLYGSQYGRGVTGSGDAVPVDLSMEPFTGSLRSDPMLGGLVTVEMLPCDFPVFIQSAEGFYTHDIGSGGMSVPDLLSEAAPISGGVDLPASFVSVMGGGTVPVWRWDGGYTGYILSPGDTLNLVPGRNTVFVGGAVKNPGPVLFCPGAGVDWYIQSAGGFSADADINDISIIHSRGVLEVDSRDSLPVPGNSSIEVHYNWISKNREYVALLVTTIGLVFTMIQISK